jgi:molybdate transport system substrate-binding protein
MKKRSALSILILAAILVLTACQAAQPIPHSGAGNPTETNTILVAAAADLQNAFTELAQIYEAETGTRVVMTFGSTGQLTQQIENGAPYDLFAAANVAYIDRLNAQGLVVPESIALYARGRIVLAVNRKSGVGAVRLEDLRSPEIGYIAIANPAHAPYGVAAREALQSSGLWEDVQDRLVLGENVRQALQYVQSGDAEVGIIALSIADSPEIAYSLLEDNLHEPLDQALAVVASSKNAAKASDFARFINSPRGRPVMYQYGFVLPGEVVTAVTPPAPAATPDP